MKEIRNDAQQTEAPGQDDEFIFGSEFCKEILLVLLVGG